MATARLFVGGVAWETTEDSLKQLFIDNGFEPKSVTIITDRDTGRSKGFAFVELSSEKEAEEAKKKLDNSELDGRTINVSDARPRDDR